MPAALRLQHNHAKSVFGPVYPDCAPRRNSDETVGPPGQT